MNIYSAGIFLAVLAFIVVLFLLLVTMSFRPRRSRKVRVSMIKTPHIRARFIANRSIIHASNEQALALKRRHDDKEDRNREAQLRWRIEYDELKASVHNQLPKKGYSYPR